MKALRYFTERDFNTANPPCKMEDMDDFLLEMIDIARFNAGIPFIINSAYRTIGWELDHARDGSSSHTKGFAVDIKAEDIHTKFLIMKALLKVGFNRIGVYDNFIHADIDENKDVEIMW